MPVKSSIVFLITLLTLATYSDRVLANSTRPQCRHFYEHENRFYLPAGLSERLIGSDESPPTRALTHEESSIFKPTLQNVGHFNKTLKYAISDTAKFEDIERNLRKKGFWVLVSPTPTNEYAGRLVGHSYLLVNGNIYSRHLADEGERSIRAVPWNNRAEHYSIGPMLKESPFFIAQFFEVSENSILALDQFAKDRVEAHTNGNKDLMRRYKFQPLSKAAEQESVENCNTFCFSWTIPQLSRYPDSMKSVEHEIGRLNLNEFPVLQVVNNQESQAYRGTLMVTDDPYSMAKHVTSADMVLDYSLIQFFGKSPATAVQD